MKLPPVRFRFQKLPFGFFRVGSFFTVLFNFQAPVPSLKSFGLSGEALSLYHITLTLSRLFYRFFRTFLSASSIFCVLLTSSLSFPVSSSASDFFRQPVYSITSRSSCQPFFEVFLLRSASLTDCLSRQLCYHITILPLCQQFIRNDEKFGYNLQYSAQKRFFFIQTEHRHFSKKVETFF